MFVQNIRLNNKKNNMTKFSFLHNLYVTQLLHEAFVICGIIKVEVTVITQAKAETTTLITMYSNFILVCDWPKHPR